MIAGVRCIHYQNESEGENMNGLIITIGRQYGSGGREIGEKLAQKLNIPCYDKLIMDEISSKSNVSVDLVEKIEENQKETMRFMVFNTYYGSGIFAPEHSIATRVHTARVNTIKELAEKGSCVMIGRGADYILKDEPHILNFYITASQEARIRRVQKRQGISEKEALKMMSDTDKNRAKFYNGNTDKKWGEAANYSLCVDSSVLGIDETVEALYRYVNAYIREFQVTI